MAKNAPAPTRRHAALASTAVVLALIAGLLAPAMGSQVSAAQSANAQSGDYPDTITIASQLFIFDRTVPLSEQELVRVGQESEIQILATSETGPFEAVYVSTPNRAEEELARYLPSGPDVDGDCLAQAADIPTATANGETYAFAGFENDIQTADLQSLAETEIAGEAATLYGAADSSGGISEFFAETSQGLYRYVQLDAGVPVNLPDEIPFGDQTLSGAASSETDVSTLTQVGCVGPYPAFAPEENAPFSEVVIEVGGQAVAFDVSEPTAPDETPAAEGTEPEASPTEVDAATPAEETAAPSPTEEEATTPAEETVAPSPTVAGDDQPVDQTGLLSPDRPERYPLTITAADQDYLFGRLVVVDVSALEQIAEQDGLVIYGGTASAVFVTTADSPEGQAARYLPIVIGADATCAVEALNVTQPFVIDDIPYAFAGVEETLTTDDLQFLENYSVQVGGQPVDAYAAPEAGTPLPEIFLDTDSGLLRFISLAEDGVPAQLEGSIPFGEQTLSGAESADVDPASLTKVGCLGPFPAYAPQGESQPPFTTVYAVLSGTVVAFQVEGGEAPATEAPTEEATPTERPTETAVPETETPVPTETAVPETETPVPTGTEVPATEPAAATETAVPATEPPAATETAPAETEAPASETAAPTTEAPTQAPSPAETVAATAVSTRVLAPVAVVPTRAPEAPPAAAETAEPQPCTGSAGAYNARGLPSNLPSRIQLGGTAYNFVQIESEADAGDLTRLGCIGPFTVASSDQAPQEELLYLRYDEAPADRPSLFRYEAGTTFSVEFEITGNAQVVASADQSYRVAETWQQIAYSSVTVILYAPEDADLSTGRVYAKRVDASVIGEYVAESEAGEVSDAVAQDAATYEINTDLILAGNRYVLVSVWTPSGTTTNGFVTLFAPRNVEAPERLLGVNPLRLGLLIYQT